VAIPAGSAVAGQTIRDAHLRDRTGALVLALREEGGDFTTNPSPDTKLQEGQILIAIGTPNGLHELARAVVDRV
jgi:K+/H+ antiporter YhaU regulatory subunit KhtT